jgi:hypothetical protein
VEAVEVTEKQSMAGVEAEGRTEETRRFVRSGRRATRRKYTPEEKIRIVLEGFRRETTVNDGTPRSSPELRGYPTCAAVKGTHSIEQMLWDPVKASSLRTTTPERRSFRLRQHPK